MVSRALRCAVLASMLVACGSEVPPLVALSPPTPSAQPTTVASTTPPVNARAAAERLAADTPRTTGEGATFTAPAGYSIRTEGALTVLETPEPDTHLALLDTRAANADAAVAVAAAWSAYRPEAKRPLKLAAARPAREGLEERSVHQYETSPNERAVVYALSYRRGDLWTVVIVDGTESTFERRLESLQLVVDSLRPKGYVRESFAGKKAHPLDGDRITQITDFVETSRRTLGIPGAAIALIEGDKIVFEGGFGVRELGKSACVDKDTQFAVASNTKGMTTLLLARLVDEGKLAWDTPGTSVYPGFKLGDAYDEAMKTRIFEPLGMKATTFDLARVEKNNHAGAHAEDVDGKPAVGNMELNRSVLPFHPAGGVWTSVHEMSSYVSVELSRGVLPGGKRLVSEKNLLARRIPQVTIGEYTTYGMGLEVDTSLGVAMMHHGGSLFGYKGDWLIFPEQGVGAIVLTNSDNGGMLVGAFRRRFAEVLFDGHAEAADDVAAQAKKHAAEIAKARERLVVPADSAHAAKLAVRYLSKELGEIAVKKPGTATVFHFGEFASSVASRKNDDGTISFQTIDPGEDGFEFVVGERGGKRVLVIRDAQHEYVFTEAS